MFTKAIVLLAVTAQAFAGVFASYIVTAPIASTTFSGGKEATVTWIDNGQAPSMKDFGPARISIYAGNALQQTSLQVIAPSVDVSTIGSVSFTVDPTIGPNSKEYFVRVESLSLKDTADPRFPALAFSAKFGLDNMTGTFSAAVQAQIDGQSTAPLAVPSSTGAAPSSTKAASSTPAATSAAASKTASASSTPKPQSGALSMKAGWAGVVLGALAGVALF